jgi:hypothetical protein
MDHSIVLGALAALPLGWVPYGEYAPCHRGGSTPIDVGADPSPLAALLLGWGVCALRAFAIGAARHRAATE